MNPFQQIPCDNFLNYFSNEEVQENELIEADSVQEKNWILDEQYDAQHEYNPFYQESQMPKVQQNVQPQRSTTQFGNDLLQNLKIKHKEEEILKNNKELFQANQSKSIYLTKISQLVETPKAQSKPKSRQKVVVDSDSSDYGNGKSKLAKNRESARNSRKRKKVYIELLEHKVEELTTQVANLEKSNQIIQSRNIYLESLMQEYTQAIKSLTNIQSIAQLQERFGAGSQKRWAVCTEIINNLIDATIPYELKRIMESATKGLDFFADCLYNQNPLIQLREKLKVETDNLQIVTQQLGQQYDKVRQQVFIIEKLKWDLLQTINAQTYINYMNQHLN